MALTYLEGLRILRERFVVHLGPNEIVTIFTRVLEGTANPKEDMIARRINSKWTEIEMCYRRCAIRWTPIIALEICSVWQRQS